MPPSHPLESDPFAGDIYGDAKVYAGEPGPMRKGRNGRNSAAAGLAVLVTLPFLMFSLVTCLFSFVFDEFGPVVWALVVSCVGVSLLLGGLYFFSGRAAHLALGVLCCFACAWGVAFGLHVHSNYMQEYNRLENGAKYHNVQPAELATAHADAAVLSFSKGSAVDTMHAVGFKKSEDTYCAAPILDGTEAGNDVQYWAVGVNCCLERGDFECYDAKEPSAHGGIVFDEDHEDLKHLKEAVHQVEEVHGLVAPKGAILLKWVADWRKIMEKLWSDGVSMITFGIALYLLASLVIVFTLNHFVKLDRR